MIGQLGHSVETKRDSIFALTLNDTSNQKYKIRSTKSRFKADTFAIDNTPKAQRI